MGTDDERATCPEVVETVPSVGAEGMQVGQKPGRGDGCVSPYVLDSFENPSRGKLSSVVITLDMKTLDECAYRCKLTALLGRMEMEQVTGERAGMNVKQVVSMLRTRLSKRLVERRTHRSPECCNVSPRYHGLRVGWPNDQAEAQRGRWEAWKRDGASRWCTSCQGLRGLAAGCVTPVVGLSKTTSDTQAPTAIASSALFAFVWLVVSCVIISLFGRGIRSPSWSQSSSP